MRVVSLRLLAATMPMIATITTPPTAIQTHGTVLVVVVVVVVEPSADVLLSVVLEPGAVIVVPLLEPAAGALCVVVVLEPVVDCAQLVAGATARKSARRMRLSRKIGRMGVLLSA